MLGGCHIKPEQFFNLIFGYYDRYFEIGSDLNAPAGNVLKSLSAVPSDEVWMLQHFHAADANRQLRIQCQIIGTGGQAIEIRDTLADATSFAVTHSGWYILKPGDYVRFLFVGVVLNDDLWWKAWGFKMKLSQ